MNSQQRSQFEPVDKPVRLYEVGALFVAGAMYIVALLTQYRAIELAAVAAESLLIITCVWNLLAPPRFSVTRCAYLCIGLVCLILLLLKVVLIPS